MRTLLKALVALILIGVIGFGAYLVASPNSDIRNSMLNAALDKADVAGKADAALRANNTEIANRLGVDVETVDQAIDQLAIDEWEVTTLPDETQATGTIDVPYEGMNVAVTTYDDPSYVTVNVEGQDITFKVADSALEFSELAAQYQ
ncbi:hypothetical protein [Slackia heliotrinireducens]|uniref:hypothetical protein n=1 Tax=Slackia heliotrinireducens TaxID=84110 RepID=UPI0033159748